MELRDQLHEQWEAATWGMERVVISFKMVRERLERSTKALVDASIPHAVIGGHAIAYWVARIDDGATRTTPEVNVLVRRADLERATQALIAVGFEPREMRGGVLFIDGPKGNERSPLYLYVAGEKVKESDVLPMPDVSDSIDGESFRVINLLPLLCMKLTAFRAKDKMHVIDLLGVGAVAASWIGRLIPELASRFQEILDDPRG